MSNVALFKAPLPASVNGEMDDDTKALAGSPASVGMRRLSIKGGVFREMIGGKEHRVSEERAMNMAVVRVAPFNSRIFYSGSYVEGQVTKPSCWSSDGQKPDAEALDKQSANCMSCPQNIKGSGTGTGRACRYQRRIAVLLDGEIDRREVYQLIAPATSIFGDGERGKMPLQKYAQHLGEHRTPITQIITEVRFDTSATQEKLVFKAIRPLTDEEYAVVCELRDSPEAIAAVSLNVAQTDGVIPSPKAALFAPEEEEEKVVAKPAKVAKKPEPVEDEDEGAEIEEPKKAASKKPAPEPKLADLVGEWDD